MAHITENLMKEATCNFTAKIKANGSVYGIPNGKVMIVRGTTTFGGSSDDYGNKYYMELRIKGNEVPEIYDCRYDMRLHPTKENGFAEFTKEFMTTSYWTGNPWSVTEINVEEQK